MPFAQLRSGESSRHAPQLAVWLVALLLILAVWQHSLALIEEDRTRSVGATESELVNLARVTQEHAERTFQGADQVLRQIVGQYREHSGRISLKPLVDQGVLDSQVLRQLFVLDAQGRLKLDTQAQPRVADLSERDYFKFQQAASADSLLISHPVRGAGSSTWSIFLSRRITLGDGSFAGVVVAELDPGYFTRFYGELALGKDAVASLFAMDGAMLARRVGRRDEFSGNVGASPLFAQLALGKQNLTLTYPSSADGMLRTYHFRKLPSYPLVVTVGVGAQEAAAAHRATEANFLQQAALASLLLLALALGSSWYLVAHRRHTVAQARALAQLQGITSSLPGAVFQFWLRADGSSSFPFASAGASELFRLSPQEIERDAKRVFTLIHPDDAAAHAESIAASARSLTPWVHEFRLRFDDGSVRWLSGRSMPQRLADGSVLWNGYVNDASARKRTESELRDAKASAEQANQAKSRFLAGASHDLRQPVAALTLYVARLHQVVVPGQDKLLGHIEASVASLSELLGDLLDSSKLAAGVVTPQLSDFAVDALLAQLVSVHTAQAQRKGLRLRFRPSGAHLRTDEALLARMVGNLIVNAIQFTHSGGVLVACRRHEGRLWVEVWDSGQGFPEDKVLTIFEEFTQLGGTNEQQGSGLGLSIVAQTAALLRLQIHVQSRPGRGSLFAIEVRPGQEHAPVIAAPAAPASKLRVALVDDNRLVLYALVLTLEGTGHEVVAAGSAHELIDSLQQIAPDIVVTDYRLRGDETGFDVIAAVREVFGAQLPAIILTGDTDPTLVRSMAERGIAVHYKPLQDEKLWEAMRLALQARGIEP